MLLKRKIHINRRGSSILTGLGYFKQAIEIDPGYALAYAGYADANMLAAAYNMCSGSEILSDTKKALSTAIRLDDSLGEAYCSWGFYYIFERNWEEAKRSFIKALEVKPALAQAHALYGMLYLGFAKGDFEEAEKLGADGY
jgi:tetratricopeptide (TPR) repeat protein